ncbi:MAG TPA: hypothetical protein VKQ36_06085 [Ktedonobacterales bacterium]|nr:hypothetical protein [Ktedonobacterales bacterium]
MRKHTWHTDSHPGLVRHLTALGETAIATEWTALERLRTNGWYTYQATLAEVTQAKASWQVIRDRATSRRRPGSLIRRRPAPSGRPQRLTG